jgi:hypothetical protein
MPVTRSYGFTDLFSLVRATKGWSFDAAGALTEAAVDALRLDHDPATLAWRGLLIEGTATNVVSNTRWEGAVAGTLGSGGALGTGWSLSTQVGLAVQVLAVGTEAGWPCIDLRFVGTTSGGGFPNLIEAQTVAAAQGQAWTGQIGARVLAGTLPAGWSIRAVLNEMQGGTTLTSTTVISAVAGEASLRTAVVPVSRTLSNATADRIRLAMVLGTPGAGQAIDVTLRLSVGCLWQSGFAFSPSLAAPGAPGASTRNADDLSMTGIERWFNAAAGTFVIDFMPGQASTPGDRDMLMIDDGTASNRIRLRMLPVDTTVRLGVTNAGVVSGALNNASGAALVRHTARFSFGPAGHFLSVNGAAPASHTDAMPAGLSRILVGTSGGANYLNGWIGPRFEFFPTQYTDAAAADGFTIRNR